MPDSSSWRHHDVEITTVGDRPHLAGADLDAGPWPEFMRHNRIAEAYFHRALTAWQPLVPGALVPVRCEVAQDRAVYVEPNVWVLHRLEVAGRMRV